MVVWCSRTCEYIIDLLLDKYPRKPEGFRNCCLRVGMLLVYWSTQKNLSQLRKINNKFSFEPLYFKKLIYFHVSISQLFESHEVNLWNSYGLLKTLFIPYCFQGVLIRPGRTILWHLEAKAQPRSPALEAKAEKISAPHRPSPCCRWGEGRSQHCQIPACLDLASLKGSGRCLARKATAVLPGAKDPRDPGTQ